MLILEKLKTISVILGSQSPRRQELLRLLDIDFKVEVKETDESFDVNKTPEQVVISIALKKLKAFDVPHYAENLVIVSDTLVADKKNRLIGKPANRFEAKDVLKNLSGESHLVYTAVAFAYQGNVTSFVEITKVQFEHLQDEEIEYYIEHYNPFDKAGSYGIQEWIGRIAVVSIDGSYENVMGLPTARLYKELKKFFAV